MYRTSKMHTDSRIAALGFPSIMPMRIKISPKEERHRYEPCGNDRVLYLAFGSNLNPKQMKIDRCSSARAEYRAIVQGWELGFGRHDNVATLRKSENATAAAVIYSLTPKDMLNLDKKEGFFKNEKSKDYARHTVHLPNNKKALVYLLLPTIPPSERPCRDYFHLIDRGLQHWLFLEHGKLLRKQGFANRDRKSGGSAIDAFHPEPVHVSSDLQNAYANEAQHLRIPRSSDEQPARNYAFSAYATVENTPAANGLIEKAIREKGELFFFHGKFTKGPKRKSHGISLTAADATLVNFRMRLENASNVVWQRGRNVDGKLALVPHSQLDELDSVEDAPGWYRREQIDLQLRVACDRGGEYYKRAHVPCQFYLMNNEYVTSG